MDIVVTTQRLHSFDLFYFLAVCLGQGVLWAGRTEGQTAGCTSEAGKPSRVPWPHSLTSVPLTTWGLKRQPRRCKLLLMPQVGSEGAEAGSSREAASSLRRRFRINPVVLVLLEESQGQ